EPTTIHQLRGTLVHRALQLLFGHDGSDRTLEVAHEALDRAWCEMSGSVEAEELGLIEGVGERFAREGHKLVEKYFNIEDPTSVTPVGVELDLRTQLGAIELRGIIDRLDRCEDGRFVLTDYKSGRSPRADRARSRLAGVLFYAYLCEEVIGVRPSEVRLVYLADEVVIVEEPTDQSMRGLVQRAKAVWSAIERACESGDFRPSPSPLCKFCTYQGHCPAFAAGRAA
ncbi:MAG TPA: PD-(D/E)XK nuclease family protein, partial [Acidimicrobiales bacterium]|nr:PD-(D/E)XK nuclease family protein [Acidimicrobiales bacterium]